MDWFVSWNGVPEASHFLFAIIFALGFVGARFFLDRFVFRNIAVCLLGADPVSLNINPDTRAQKKKNRTKRERMKKHAAIREKTAKCSESLWKFTYYAAAEICVLNILYSEPWSRDTNEYFRGWPNQELKLALSLYYMCQCGFYLYSIIALLTWETRRRDCPVMMSHHVITVILIVYSYITGFFQIGSIILALHDASDVFMEAAKVSKYCRNELGASMFFGLFAISWLVLRLIFFPFWVIKASSYDFMKHLDLSDPYCLKLYYVFNTMLLTLLVFHIYWWYLICSMIVRLLVNKGKVGEDIRSDSEDDA